MTIEEIKAALDKLTAAMLEKGITAPSAELTLRRVAAREFEGEWLKQFHSETVADALAAASAYIAARPTPETAAMHEYMRRLGKAVDFGVANGIAAEYVDPVRITQKAMTDNLLAAPTAEASHA
jgi:hypothetical protein